MVLEYNYFLKTVLKNGVRIIFGCTLYTSKYGIPTHNIQKLSFNTLEKKRTVLKLSLTVFNNSEVFLLLDFLKCMTCRREKILAFLMTCNENERILPSHLCCDICAKGCQCGQTVNKCKDDTKKHDSSDV